MKFEPYIGLRYLLSKKRNAMLSLFSVISFLGVTIGVMALVVVLSVMSGAEEEFKNKILGANAHILVLSQAQRFTNYKQVMRQIESNPQVKAATPFIYSEVMLSSELGASSGVLIYGIDPQSAVKVIKLKETMVMGGLAGLLPGNNQTEAEAKIPGIVIGRQLSKDLNVLPGDKVTLIAPFAELTPMGISPKIRVLKVVGIFESGMWQFDSKFVYLNLSVAQKMFLMDGAVHGLEVSVKDLDNVTTVTNELRQQLGQSFRVRSWIEMNGQLFSAFELEKKTMFVILAMIILVASFNIIGTLVMFVNEKSKDIAVLKSLGASRRSIMNIFMITGSFIGLAGTASGLFIGYWLCILLREKIRIPLNQEVYQIDYLPVSIEPLVFLLVAVTAVIISLVATLYPSIKAANVSPAEGLRYE